MSLSLHDAIVPHYAQILSSVSGFMEKGRQHFEANSIDPDAMILTRYFDDMAPFRFQAICICHHSLGALKGVQAGVFTPPPELDLDYSGLQALVAETRAGLADFPADIVNGFEGSDLEFRLGEMVMPFTAEDFLMSFSLPNFYFHATTAYDILRARGVAIGKRDFLGQIRLKG